ncbi:MAG: hypothetical protein ACK5X9_07975 [Alphaproteobacteria bacterium]
MLGVTWPAFSVLPNERAVLSPEMVIRVEKALGVSMDTLTRMQGGFDTARPSSRGADQGRLLLDHPRVRPKPPRNADGRATLTPTLSKPRASG